MTAWSFFYAATATAAATLMGLLFVAVSIAAPRALNERHSPIRNRAEQSFHNYILVLSISCFMLIPELTPRTVSHGVLAMTVTRALWAIVRAFGTITHLKTWRAGLRPLRQFMSSIIGLTFVLIAAVRVGTQAEDALALLAAGTIIIVISSAIASWELLHQFVANRHFPDEGRYGELGAGTAKELPGLDAAPSHQWLRGGL